MLLYTLVIKEDNEFRLLGSTFESDVAIYLYFKHIEIYDDMYFIWTETDFDFCCDLQDFNDFEIEFFVQEEDGNITKLAYEDRLNIYKLRSPYYTETQICSISEEAENEYSTIVEQFEDRKIDLLPEKYEEQDEVFFENFYDSEVLFVGVLTYPVGEETNVVLTGASYNEQVAAYLLQQKISELKPDWCHYYFRHVFVFKNQINNYLNESKEMSFLNYSTDNSSTLTLTPLEKNEEQGEFELFSCKYMSLTAVPEDKFEIFMSNEWCKFEREFNPFGEDLDTNNPKETFDYYYDIIINKYLIHKTDWIESLEFLKEVCFKENVSISVDSDLMSNSIQYNLTEAPLSIGYLKESLGIALHEGMYDELVVSITVNQKTSIQSSEGVFQERSAAFLLTCEGVYNVLSENYLQYQQLDPITGEHKVKPKNITYVDSRTLLKTLGMKHTTLMD